MHTFTLLFHQQTPSGIELQHDTVSFRAGAWSANSGESCSILTGPSPSFRIHSVFATSIFTLLILGLGDDVLLILPYSHVKYEIWILTFWNGIFGECVNDWVASYQEWLEFRHHCGLQRVRFWVVSGNDDGDGDDAVEERWWWWAF